MQRPIIIVVEPTEAQRRQIKMRYQLFGYVVTETQGGADSFVEGKPRWMIEKPIDGIDMLRNSTSTFTPARST